MLEGSASTKGEQRSAEIRKITYFLSLLSGVVRLRAFKRSMRFFTNANRGGSVAEKVASLTVLDFPSPERSKVRVSLSLRRFRIEGSQAIV